jgi:hypothetical protein
MAGGQREYWTLGSSSLSVKSSEEVEASSSPELPSVSSPSSISSASTRPSCWQTSVRLYGAGVCGPPTMLRAYVPDMASFREFATDANGQRLLLRKRRATFHDAIKVDEESSSRQKKRRRKSGRLMTGGRTLALSHSGANCRTLA